MPWNPGASFSYINLQLGNAQSPTYTSETVGDGRFAQSKENLRPVVALSWTGPVGNTEERVSFWFNHHAYMHQAPLRTEFRQGVLWGFFAVDTPTASATPRDVLDDYNRSLPQGTSSNWNSEGTLLVDARSPTFGLVSVAWQGGIPADRKDWVDFCSQIPFANADYPMGIQIALSLSPTSSVVTGYFASRRPTPTLAASVVIGFWEPSLDWDGSFRIINNKLAFEWKGDPSTDTVVQSRPAYFWYRGLSYQLAPDEIIPSTAYSSRFGLVPIPTVTTVCAAIPSPYRGAWDYAARLSVDSAVVQWQGRMPCSLTDSRDFLKSVGGNFLLGTVRYLSDNKALFVMGLDTARKGVYGVFTVGNQSTADGAMRAADDVTWSPQLIQDGLLTVQHNETAPTLPPIFPDKTDVPYREVFKTEVMAGIDKLIKEFPEANPSLLVKKIIKEALDGYLLNASCPHQLPAPTVDAARLDQQCPVKRCPPTSSNGGFLALALLIIAYVLYQRFKK